MLEKQLYIFVCHNFASEILAILDEQGHKDVVVHAMEVNCSGPLVDSDSMERYYNECRDKYHKVVIFGNSCFNGMPNITEPDIKYEYLKINQCFDIIIPPRLSEYYVKKQYYLVSPGWFDNYDQNIANWGFGPSIAKKFFQECTKGILYLDTGIIDIPVGKLEDLSQYMGVNYEILPVGLDYVRSIINSIIFKWRAGFERELANHHVAEANQKSADYGTIFHQLNSFLGLTDLERLFEKVFNLFDMLFAPDNIQFLHQGDDKREDIWFRTESKSEALGDKKFFEVSINFGEDSLGVFRIYNVKFPEHIDRYKKMVELVGGMFSLAYSNSEKFTIISKNEKQLQEQAMELKNHIDLKDRLMSVIAHDLRSPFNSILGLSELLYDDYHEFDDASRKSMLHQLAQSSQTYFHFLENLLVWARSKTGELTINLKSIDFYNLVDNCIDIFKTYADHKGIRLKNEISKATFIYADSNMVTTIVRNLISNALKFTNPGGLILIQTNSSPEPSSGFLKFCVKDSGIGMTQAQVESMLNSNVESTKGTSNEPGSGLGLSIIKEMIARHNGDFKVKSKPGKGSCFTFTLPVKSENSVVS